jgi:integrase
MASISTDPNGNRTVQFVDADRKRRSVRLGKVPMKSAEEVCRRVEALVASRITGTSPDAETSRWVRDLSPALAAKLARVGLVGPRPEATTLDAFVRGYIAGRTDLKPSTLVGMEQARDRLSVFFDPLTPLRDVTQADADRWLIHLRGKYAEATAARTLKRARQFFTAAKRARLITDNPFEGIKPGSMKNAGRLFYVTADMAAKLIEACPDADWRAIVALCRFGGLRCPSEVLALTWGDVDWERGRFLVRASKTEHHEHRGMRWVPLFPELRPHLEAVWDPESGPAQPVITRYRDAAQNMRTTFEKIIVRAGLEPWPRLMQNLRATRETELAARFPLHVVTAWMGNTEAVAARHYLSVRDEDFAEALKVAGGPGRAADSGAATVRNEREGTQPNEVIPSESPCLQGISDARPGCIPLHERSVAAVGLEPTRPVRGRGF